MQIPAAVSPGFWVPLCGSRNVKQALTSSSLSIFPQHMESLLYDMSSLTLFDPPSPAIWNCGRVVTCCLLQNYFSRRWVVKALEKMALLLHARPLRTVGSNVNVWLGDVRGQFPSFSSRGIQVCLITAYLHPPPSLLFNISGKGSPFLHMDGNHHSQSVFKTKSLQMFQIEFDLRFWAVPNSLSLLPSIFLSPCSGYVYVVVTKSNLGRKGCI